MNAPTTDLDALCDLAERFHQDARARLDALHRELGAEGVSPRLAAPWRHVRGSLIAHFAEEEEILFPALRKIWEGQTPHGDVWRSLLDDMERELDEVRTLADALRAAAREAGPHEDALLELLDALEEHAALEESTILPAARAALGEPVADPGWLEPAVSTDGGAPARPSLLARAVRRLRALHPWAARATG